MLESSPTGCEMLEGMARRRCYDPLAPIPETAWLVVIDRFGKILDSRELPAGTDLRAVLTRAHSERLSAGWSCDPISPHCTCCFCTREGTRLMLGIHRVRPGEPLPSHSTPK